MSTATAETAVRTATVNGQQVYYHVLIVPEAPRPGEYYGVEVANSTIEHIVTAANRLQVEQPLHFPVRRYGDLTPAEVEAVHYREAVVINRVFMDSGADVDIARQLVTFAICRWGHTLKRVSVLLQAIEKAEPTLSRRFYDELRKASEPAPTPQYGGPR